MTNRETKQIILERCPKYDDISNYIYLEKDNVSKRLIEEYQEYIFSIDINNKEELIKLEMVNKVLEKYISDYNFAKDLRNYLNSKEFKAKSIKTEELIETIINFLARYEEESLKHISNTRWL